MNKFGKVSAARYIVDGGTADKYEAIKLPQRATPGSAGYDIYSPLDFKLGPGETILIKTGINVELDEDKFLAIYPRSGQGFKYKIQLWNSVAVIDEDYRWSANEGHIMLKLYNDSPEGKTMEIHAGDAIAQGIIQQYFKTENDSPVKSKRNGGLGSTG